MEAGSGVCASQEAFMANVVAALSSNKCPCRLEKGEHFPPLMCLCCACAGFKGTLMFGLPCHSTEEAKVEMPVLEIQCLLYRVCLLYVVGVLSVSMYHMYVKCP